ncbi:hypothetical protein E2320_002114, partial [Naja naja]
MGSLLFEEQRKHVDELGYLLKKNHNEVSQCSLIQLVQEIAAQCLWYPEKGSLQLADWGKIGSTLHTEPQASVEVLHLWHLCRHAIEKFGTVAISLLMPSPPCYIAPIVCPPSSSESMTITPSAPVDTGQHSHDPPVQSSFQKMVETCKRDASVTDYGISSNFTRGLLEGIKNGYTMILEDWKQVFCMILTSMQYVVWESEYMRHAQAVALGGGGAYTVEQLFGSGQFAAVPAQT